MTRPEVVVSDTSCLIVLSKIAELDLLRRLYDRVLVPKVVSEEFGELLPDWIDIQDAKPSTLTALNNLRLGPGEQAAFALAIEKDALIIVDENLGRTVARRLNIRFTGTLGVIVKAKQQGLISSVGSVLDKIQKTNFRMSATLISKTLEDAGELQTGEKEN